MSIKQQGGVFGRNPTFNDLTIEGDLILNGEVFTGLDFQGSWNASTNSPSLASSTGTNGEFYIVSVAGTTNLNGITNWGIGDWAIFNGTVWQRVEGGADGNFNALTANSLTVNGDVSIPAGSLSVASNTSVTGRGLLVDVDNGTITDSRVKIMSQTSGQGELSFRTGGTASGNEGLHISQTQDVSIPNGSLSVDAGGSRSNLSNTHVRLTDGFNVEWGGGTNYIRGSNASNEVKIATNSLDRFNIASNGSLSTPTLGTSNLRFGANAGKLIASGGIRNVIIGDEAGTAITTGDSNVAVGYEALKNEDSHGTNTALGTQTLFSQNAGVFAYNTAVGFQAGSSISTGVQNVLICGLAGDALQDADDNTVLGFAALSNDVLGSKSVAVGRGSLQAQNPVDGSGNPVATDMNNTAVGYFAGASVTTGVQNTLIGSQAGDALSDADFNVGMGTSALGSDTKGSRNVAIGHSSLATQNFTSGTNSYNTAVGFHTGLSVTDGIKNTLIGALAGNTLTTGSLNVALGYNVDFGAIGRARSIGIGNNFTVSGDDRIQIGNGSNIATLLLNGSATTWSASSDERLKENIETSTAGLSFINDLRPVTYNWKKAKDVLGELPQHIEGSDEPCLGHTYGALKHGFIAQEVKTVIDNHSEVKDGQEIWQIDDTNVQALAPSALVPMLVKAIQELSAQVDALTARIETLEG